MGNPLYLVSLMTEAALRRAAAGFLTSPLYRWRYAGTRTAKLSIAPQDLRTADPTVAAEIYSGRFAFAGKSALAGGRSPFELQPPSAEWAEALYSFGWLRHLRAADSALARANARALVEEWIDIQGRWHNVAWSPEITARRVLAWLAQSPLVLEHADFTFYRKFVTSLTRQVNYLARIRKFAPAGIARLRIVIALAQASLCLDASTLQRRARRWLERELQTQILADGGHVSRNPWMNLQILLDLLPLRHSYTAMNQMPPQALLNAIDRMIPMVRFFRHGDGAFALFNGMGATPTDVVATLLAYDEARGLPPAIAPLSGYLRLEADGLILLMDGGAPPPLLYSANAHAGPLSFELSDHGDRMIINCGSPWSARSGHMLAPRLTRAHSTLEIANSPCADFVGTSLARRLVGTLLVDGAHRVQAEMAGREIVASHDGYAKSHGVLHKRNLVVSEDGALLSGHDEIVAVAGATLNALTVFTLHFHLHPSVKASMMRDQETILLVLPGRRAWSFRAVGFRPDIEDSVYYGGADGARRTLQIVIRGSLGSLRDVRWRFERAALGTVSDGAPSDDTAKLPL